MTKRDTCGGCPHLMATKGAFQIIGCEVTGNVVPHSAEYVSDKLSLHRIPMDCPLPDDEVSKNPDGYESPKPHHMKVSEVPKK